MDFNGLKVHFIGIGGIGVSGLARFLKAQGAIISGSDIAHTSITDQLETEGIKINIPHDRNVIADKDLIIHSAIIKDSNVEIIEARALHKRIFSRKDALRVLLSKKRVLSVCAAHGKSSTSAILASILKDSGAIIGAISKEFNSNVRVSNSDLLVFEADESDKSFLNSNPYKSIIINIEAEHLESYNNDFSRLKEAYKDFINSSYISVLNIDCPNVANIYHDMGNVESALVGTGSILCKEEDSNPDSNNMPLSSTHLPLIMPFSPKQDISNISYILKDNLPFTRFNLKDLGIFEVYGIGEHNAINASMAILSALEFLDIKSIKENLLNFRGIKKRFDILENLSPDSPCIIDDYAHHPTEILATLNALKIYKDLLSDSKLSITAIFQPHKYSRLRDNLEAFCNCFHHCDDLVILPVWAAGEDKIDFDFESLFAKYNPVFASRIKRKGKHIALINECGEEFRILQSNIIIGLGAGDITYQIRGEK